MQIIYENWKEETKNHNEEKTEVSVYIKGQFKKKENPKGSILSKIAK